MTKYIYEIVNNPLGGSCIKRTDENGQDSWIPTDLANSDYQEYLNPSAQSKEITTPQGGTE